MPTRFPRGRHLTGHRQPQARQLRARRFLQIHRHRRQYRKNHLREILLHRPHLRRTQLAETKLAHTTSPQLGPQLAQQQVRLRLNERLHPTPDAPQLLRRRQSRRVFLTLPGPHQRRQSAHPDHEKLVQISRCDSEELQAFQQWGISPHGLSQHPAVKFKPALFAVKKMRLIRHEMM